MTMHFRPYRPADRAACLAIFDSNVPQFFARHERREFADFLDAPTCTYFVVEDATGIVIGCGGYHYDADTRRAVLCWGMVTRAQHRTGVGSLLLRQRLRHLCAASGGQAVLTLMTSQHTCGFFARFGFVTTQITEDGFAPGLHRVDMTLDLTTVDCAAWG